MVGRLAGSPGGNVGEDVTPAGEEQLMRPRDEPKGGMRKRAGVLLADRRRAHPVDVSPPERHRGSHVGEREPPRPPQVRELVRKPQSTAPKRLCTPPRIRSIGEWIPGRRRGPPPPLLEATRSKAR